MKSFFGFFFFYFIFSCATKVDREEQDQTLIYQSTALDTNSYFSCGLFADETFRGYIWADAEDSSQKACVYVEISKSPEELLKNDNLFLQIYPFSVIQEKMKYGSSAPIKTIRKFTDKEELLMESQIIDAHLVEAMLKLDPDYFFLDHLFKICDVSKKWDGLQFVIYERREYQDEPTIIRKTKALLPPFLAHPEYYRESKGPVLAALHPLLDSVPELKSSPSAYYDLAEKLCRPIK